MKSFVGREGARRLIMHAGTHKTGTTTLQHCLYEHRRSLAEHGIIYPVRKAKGEAGGKVRRSHHWIAHTFTGRYDFPREDVVAAFNDGPGKAYILSSEDLSACCSGHPLWSGIGSEEFRSLQQDYLSGVASFFSEFEIEPVLVFRRVDEYAHSLYQTLVAKGSFRGAFEDFLSLAEPLLHYREQISAFERVFGKPKVLSFHALSGEDMTNRFLQAIGSSFSVPAGTQTRKNQSTDARITFWQATREPEADAFAKRRFGLSQTARSLFPDFGAATFWPDALSPTTLHDRYAEGFPDGFFPPLRRGTQPPDARIKDRELDRISESYHRWLSRPKQGKSPIRHRSLVYRLRERLFGPKPRGGPGPKKLGAE